MKNRFPFDAAIFDLDGTLLDSMYVWKRVDEIYFEKKGMAVPEDYGRALAGLSYRESAEYTKARFGFQEPWQDIVREWTELAREEYARNVRLKSGAREYLTALRRCGVKLAVATALPEYLYRPCLEHLGILDWFEALCSTDDTGGRGKGGGEVFLLAARRLGAAAKDCAVFEDVLEGVRGAKRAGMRAYCVLDDASRHAHGEIAEMADGMIGDYLAAIPFRRCAIVTARCEGDLREACAGLDEDDLILCADAGYHLARAAGLRADAVIGDFDSSDAPEEGDVLRHPVVKDDTDAMLCARYALEMGARDFRLIGGLGGRLDHTLANLQTLGFLAEAGARAELCDGNVRALAVRNGGARVAWARGKLSVFALSGRCEGVYIRNAKYELRDATLTPLFPLGMGNDFLEGDAEVGVREGTLLVISELR